ncbi:hypothetical protein IscW_ISCW007569 [Ixodes scapularis]|uniref:Uncharacterized protein n=1 Tax=Ixodes scapularis TaxID=6945 RepID=B7PWF8_IXOSC|nr:hypothetical protein IscW_ISCW007569 [Ixodes scapularis]|eukprot:XP_002409754.1 hypothetical protein IscW_ISCW007569 [Ixodes scapularis]
MGSEQVPCYCRLPFSLDFGKCDVLFLYEPLNDPPYTRAQTKIPVLKSSLESGV